jgi:hypothetical protein
MRGSRQLSNARPTSATLVSHSGFAAAMVRLSATDHLASDEAHGRIGVRLRCSGNGLASSDIAVQKSTKHHNGFVPNFGSVSDASSRTRSPTTSETQISS